MGTKAQISTLIEVLENNGLNTAAEVRDVLKDNANSLLNNSYGDVLNKAKAPNVADTPGIFTSDSDTSYSISVSKQGRRVTVNGRFNFAFSQTPTTTILTLDISSFPDYEGNGTQQMGIATNQQDGTSIGIYMEERFLKLNSSILGGEDFIFSITYNTQD